MNKVLPAIITTFKFVVSINGNSLQYASNKLRNDKEIVEFAVSQSGSVLKYASSKLQNDKEIIELSKRILIAGRYM
jgi:hypothetical protein